MRPTLVLLLCAAPALASDPPRPQPGVDLDGPPPPPARSGRHGGGHGLTLDLGADRPPAALRLPAPPRGGAATFTVGDDRKGWIAHIPESQKLPAVAYDDGRLFVSGGFDAFSFYALDAGDGHMLWAAQQLEDNGPTAAVALDGKVIFNTESCTLFVIDARSGKKLWMKYLGDPTLAQPSVADGLIFASHPRKSGGQVLSAMRLDSGKTVWSRAIDGELLAAPVVAGDSVYAATITGRVVRFERSQGKRLWSKPLGATSAPWVAGDELYFARRDGQREVQVVAAVADGTILRTHRGVPGRYLGDVPRDLDDWPKVWGFEGSRPVVDGGVRYEAMGGIVAASDAASGEVLWTRRLAGSEDQRSIGSVAVAGPQVVIATRAGDLYGLDIDTGYTTWAYRLGKRVVAQPVVAAGWIYAATADGHVVALQVGDRSLDGWHMWGGNPAHNGRVP